MVLRIIYASKLVAELRGWNMYMCDINSVQSTRRCDSEMMIWLELRVCGASAFMRLGLAEVMDHCWVFCLCMRRTRIVDVGFCCFCWDDGSLEDVDEEEYKEKIREISEMIEMSGRTEVVGGCLY